MIKYYKTPTQVSRFNDETAELIHIMNNDGNLSIIKQMTPVGYESTIASTMTGYAEEATVEEFNQAFALAKEIIDAI